MFYRTLGCTGEKDTAIGIGGSNIDSRFGQKPISKSRGNNRQANVAHEGDRS